MRNFPPWMRGVLLLAGVYNFIWGVFIFLSPSKYYLWLSGNSQTEPFMATAHSLGILLFAVLYLTAAIAPQKFWYLPWLGLASKLLGGLLVYVVILDANLHLPDGSLNRHFIFHLIMNDLVWVPPLLAIAMTARKWKNVGHSKSKSFNA